MTIPEWRFEQKRRSQKTRNPMQASFFTNESIDDDSHALVREAIQNSLDARIKGSSKPARVRFSLGTLAAGNKQMERYLSDDAWRHYHATDSGLQKPPIAGDACRYLVFEDFNTTGLVGDETTHEAAPGNAFYYFLRAEGQSGKEEGDLGRHGIGKYVFPRTSRIRTFFVLTIRSTDQHCLTAGQSILNTHTVDGKSYTPDGWWGEFAEDEFQLPVIGSDAIANFAKDFGLTRKAGESGLSVIMPYVPDEIEADLISRHVILEYFLPILKGQLIVDVVDGDNTRQIDADGLRNSLDKLVPADTLKAISAFIELGIASIDAGAMTVVDLPRPQGFSRPIWNKDLVDKASAQSIANALELPGAELQVRVPVCVRRVGEEAAWSVLDLFIRREEGDDRRKPHFVREGITIPEDRVGKIRGYTCLAMIEPGPLATLLGDSENPAHTEWEKNAVKFKGRYQWGSSTIDFVRLSFRKLLGLLAQADEDEDRDVLSNIFFLDLPEDDDGVPSKRKRRKRVKTKDLETIEPVVDPPVRSAKQYQLSKISGGFSLTGSASVPAIPRKIRVRVAYDVVNASKAKALNDYHKNDFLLTERITKHENASDVKIGEQSITFETTDNSFRLEATGFDERRDLIVDVAAAAVIDETV